MQRVRSERGAVAVVVAILMVALVGFTAIAVDVGMMQVDRVQLQNGADSAALAIAADCANGNCGNPPATAKTLTEANKNDGAVHDPVTIEPAGLSPGTGWVKVTPSSTRQHWFAPLLGIDESDISASATARWRTMSGGSTVPLGFAFCEFENQFPDLNLWLDADGNLLPGAPFANKVLPIFFPDPSDPPGCTLPSGVLPGGFGWMQPPTGQCAADTHVGDWVEVKEGVPPPSDCDTDDLSALLGTVVPIPLFDAYENQHLFPDGSKSKAYRIHAYIGYRITGYYFGGQYKEGCDDNDPSDATDYGCTGNERWIEGTFTYLVYDDADIPSSDEEDASDPVPSLGVTSVGLTE